MNHNTWVVGSTSVFTALEDESCSAGLPTRASFSPGAEEVLFSCRHASSAFGGSPPHNKLRLTVRVVLRGLLGAA
jgi:hypothetical protein